MVSTNHLDQVSATAKTAIDAATASESNLIRMLSIAGAVIGIGLAIAAFFGFREFKDFQKHLLRMRLTVRRSNQQLTELNSFKNKVVPALQAMLAEVQEMEGILIDLSFLHNINRRIDELHQSGSPDLVHTAAEALPEGKKLFERAESHHKRLLESAPNTDLPPEASVRSKEMERVLSYVAAVMGVVSMRAESLDDAVEWAERSVKYNPRNYDDREYNLACALAKRGAAADQDRAFTILEQEFAKKASSWVEAWRDSDFSGIREKLKHSRFADPDILSDDRVAAGKHGVLPKTYNYHINKL